MLYTMDANHVRKGLEMYLNGNPTKYTLPDKPAQPLCYVVNDQLTAQYVNDVLINNPNGKRVFVGLATVSLHQQGANGVLNIYDLYNNLPAVVIPELTMPLPQLQPRHFTINVIMARFEQSVTWITKYGVTFCGYTFEYQQL